MTADRRADPSGDADAGGHAEASGLMRVAIDARALDRPELAERGIGRYVQSLLAALLASDRDVVALRDLKRPPLPNRIREVTEHALLGRDARAADAHVLHSPSTDLATTRPGLPYVVTVHDLVPLKQPERYLRTGLKHRLRYAAAKRATRLITPTRAVARDCHELLGVPDTRIDVIAEAPGPAFQRVTDPERALARFRLPERYLIWVGGLDPPDPRKGLPALARAVAAGSGLPLVLVGRVGPEAADLAAPGRVILAGRASDEELAALYTRAAALVLPSEDEGFGLTVIEALACGTPVAAFDVAALAEQHEGNDAVRLVEPGDVDALIEAAELLTGTRAAAPARTWAEVAGETWATYAAASRSSVSA